ncbi:arginine N-succinyltransferase [Tamilnaduibacter salinus]|uniref:Arginine N-succinyltransferase n=1 Tax=Tamilnaduibacter salinus TaxID=1484056 RepID=A0A2A2I5G1_9GAMM|nr:arginine N-succinyltransferase [Tamilnaduibacter salinus]PAV26524.1 arginine N-succinyltransferase [Tamilnaduibacter salinus]PVY75912.1 arginine N-succinyltransferase [Tamilnaduibacter salinus]
MRLIRPLQADDLDDLYRMAGNAGKGLTSLPPDREFLARKIDRADATFSGRQPADAGMYLFALSDTDTHQCVGISGIEARVGQDEVFYNYRLSTNVTASRELGVHVRTPTLYLTNDMTDATEICSLLLDADHRGGGNGLLLSRCRFLFMADFGGLFADKVFAEMRGYSDEDGHSPLWESLGRLFFNMDFAEADRLSVQGDKSFIAELMPKYPIYLPLLPADARAVVGQVHEGTAPALKMLEAEGFNFNGLVDIFDGGPVVEAFLHNVRTVRESRLRPVTIASGAPRPAGPLSSGDQLMVSNRSFADFRVITAPRSALTPDHLQLNPAEADALAIEDGDVVRASPLKTPTTEGPSS